MEWKVYVYETDFEQEVFDILTSSLPSDEENVIFLSKVLEVEIGDENIPPLYEIVDRWLQKYKSLSVTEKYVSLYPQIRSIEEWISLVNMSVVKLPLTLCELHGEFEEQLDQLPWKDKAAYNSLFLWSLYLPVLDKLRSLTEFEAGTVYARLPNSISEVSNSEELETTLRKFFCDEVARVMMKNSHELEYRTIHPLELNQWNGVYAAFMM
jgi:hypothetical protein